VASGRSAGSPRLLRAALIALGAFLLVAAYLHSIFRSPSADRVEPALGVVGVNTGRSLAWILRTAHGAALIDAGLEPDAGELVKALRAQGLDASRVHSVLVTHAHPDHWGGAAAFPAAKVYAGAGDAPVLQRQAKLKGPLAWAMDGMMPVALGSVERVEDGQVLSLDGEEVRAIALPGHTPGSTAYLWKDLLFSGDALLGRGADAVGTPPWMLCEDASQARRSLEKLREVPFTRMADGHSGATADARLKLLRLLRR